MVSSRIYEEIGVHPVINAWGNATRLGGSVMSPSVLKAMNEANELYVDMDELMRATGKVIAGVLGAEAAFVTSGCAAAMVLGTAASMTGDDMTKLEKIPNTEGMKNEIIIQKKSRYKYDRIPTLTGATLVEVGTEEGTNKGELARAIGPKTACILYFARATTRPGVLPLDDVLEVAHGKGVPVLVDAAGEVYPLNYFRSFLAKKADLVCYGAKYFGGPNSAGLLAGRKRLVELSYMQSFMGFETTRYRTLGRPLKVDRQEVIGTLIALKEWMIANHELRLAPAKERAKRIINGLKGIEGLTVGEYGFEGPTLRIPMSIDESVIGKTIMEVKEALRNGNPPIWVWDDGSSILVCTSTLRDGEDEVIAKRLREELTRRTSR